MRKIKKQSHTFDVRMEFAVRDLKEGRRNEPIACLHCKQMIDREHLKLDCDSKVK